MVWSSERRSSTEMKCKFLISVFANGYLCCSTLKLVSWSVINTHTDAANGLLHRDRQASQALDVEREKQSNWFDCSKVKKCRRAR